MTLQKRKSKSSRSSRKPTPQRGSTSNGRQPRTKPRTVPLAEIKDDLSKYLRLAVDEEIVIARHGRAAGILIGFASEDDWFDYRLEHHPGVSPSHRRGACCSLAKVGEHLFENSDNGGSNVGGQVGSWIWSVR